MNTTHSYHDAEIASIAYSRAHQSVLLNLKRVAGDEARLMFSGVKAFRVNDFGLQNVVSRLLISTTHTFSHREVQDYVQWARSQHDYKASLPDKKAAEISASLSRGELTLFVAEPSVGAEIVIQNDTARPDADAWRPIRPASVAANVSRRRWNRQHDRFRTQVATGNEAAQEFMERLVPNWLSSSNLLKSKRHDFSRFRLTIPFGMEATGTPPRGASARPCGRSTSRCRKAAERSDVAASRAWLLAGMARPTVRAARR